MQLPARLVSGPSSVKKTAGKTPRKSPTKSGKFPRKTPSKAVSSPSRISTSAARSTVPYRSPAKRTLKIKRNPRSNGFFVYSPQPLSTLEESSTSPQSDFDPRTCTESQTSWQSRSHCINRDRVFVSGGTNLVQGYTDNKEPATDMDDSDNPLVHNKAFGARHLTVNEPIPASAPPTSSNKHLIVIKKIDGDIDRKDFIKYLASLRAEGCSDFWDDGPATEGYRRGKATVRVIFEFKSKTSAQEAVRKLDAYGFHGHRTFAELVEK